MPVRIEKETLFLRRDFTEKQRAEMGVELAQAYNRQAAITEDEKVMKAQINERTKTTDAKIGELSRKLNDGYDMVNVQCELVYDTPNVGEVSYKRTDNGEIAKVRPMTEMERQMDLPLQEPATPEAEQKSIEASTAAAEEFFGSSESPAENKTAESNVAEMPAPGGKKKGK